MKQTISKILLFAITFSMSCMIFMPMAHAMEESSNEEQIHAKKHHPDHGMMLSCCAENGEEALQECFVQIAKDTSLANEGLDIVVDSVLTDQLSWFSKLSHAPPISHEFKIGFDYNQDFTKVLSYSSALRSRVLLF